MGTLIFHNSILTRSPLIGVHRIVNVVPAVSSSPAMGLKIGFPFQLDPIGGVDAEIFEAKIIAVKTITLTRSMVIGESTARMDDF